MINKFSGLGYSKGNGINYNKLASGNVSSSKYMSKLASTESRGAIYVLKSSLRREIYNVNKSDMDDSQKKAAIARIKNVMRKADEKVVKLNHEKRMKERIRQEERAEDREEEQTIIKRYRSKVYNRKKSERLDVLTAAACEEKQMQAAENYSTYTDAGTSGAPVAGDVSGSAGVSIDVMV
ncbi:hypothetical protein [Sedimentibacter sp.]|uniref:hypothetical protein n=1 Tax=Sedimentibacter sp. TaxID=1960295 RepID=UPI0028996C91|nr:hypothetical protein [Sedimentibacter sp.]